ncbi:unnamed protein product [Soboliphyme baturini]|uniref:HNF-p1 domain-containing protein n=1 Tax=Soboliphyme baturini TaxID=241478 RepID=A0A183I9L1_9BILA|nr:unnamed protein product [Soboliphyme baturini]
MNLFTVEQVELLRRLRLTGITAPQIIEIRKMSPVNVPPPHTHCHRHFHQKLTFILYLISYSFFVIVCTLGLRAGYHRSALRAPSGRITMKVPSAFAEEKIDRSTQRGIPSADGRHRLGRH